LLLKLFVVVSLQLDEWLKNLLVLLRVLIAQEYLLEGFFLWFLSQVVDSCLGLFLPHFLEVVDLLNGNLACTSLFFLRWWSDQPANQTFILK